ncbi:MAG: hypothetical protein LBR25_05530 [Erysipelotrichaceae bacterium]|jgi:hypothetical protein|nr:hypothetical protein [Erysipelotrichaceae bacterium]
MKLTQKLKQAINNWLENLASENKKHYGEERLDCCTINQKPQTEEVKDHGESA